MTSPVTAMADLPNDFWSGYIVGLTAISFVVLAWLVFDVFFRKGGDPEVAEHVWDDDLREGQTPAPMWWFWLILATMVFSVCYLMLYPGLGNFPGMLHYSQGHELTQAREQYRSDFGAAHEQILASSDEELARDPVAMATASNIFRVHCSGCHGEQAGGQAELFPALDDSEWQWGNTAAEISRSIETGRLAVMPPWIAALQAEGTAEVTEYVLALAEGRSDDPAVAAGRARYEQLCVACHLADGSGNALLGASPLDNDVWTYGSDYDAVYASIADGRSGQMPAFGERLDDVQIRLLTAWLVAGAPGQK